MGIDGISWFSSHYLTYISHKYFIVVMAVSYMVYYEGIEHRKENVVAYIA